MTIRKLPEADIDCMNEVIEIVKIVLPILGFTFLESIKDVDQNSDNQQVFVLKGGDFADGREYDAKAIESDDTFIVFKDSKIAKNETSVMST